jgi:NADPH:quinone reductase-like Zn-dependent oxidoreductase
MASVVRIDRFHLKRQIPNRRAGLKAAVFTQYGGPGVLRYEDVPDPIVQHGEVVVDVRAASVNGVDHKVRRGGGPYTANFPHILGRDFSGVVSEVGPGVEDFAVGDQVFGVLDQGIEGAYAERLAVNAAIIARKPDWLDHVEAAALALTGLTAIWAIEDTVRLEAGETILIHGGAGGVAGIAIQLARRARATVTTTASATNHEYVKGLGADHVIDYTTEDFTKVGPVYDVVFDTVGGDIQIRSHSVLKPGGRLVWIAPAPQNFQPGRQDISIMRPAVFRDRAHLERIVFLLQTGAVVLPEIQRFKLSEAANAHQISEGRPLRGKLVLEIGQTP